MRLLRYVLVGAAVLVATAAFWWLLSAGLSLVMGPAYAGLVALVIIVAAGWAANGLLVWRQLKRGPDRRG
jgi:hypothetical protein